MHIICFDHFNSLLSLVGSFSILKQPLILIPYICISINNCISLESTYQRTHTIFDQIWLNSLNTMIRSSTLVPINDLILFLMAK